MFAGERATDIIVVVCWTIVCYYVPKDFGRINLCQLCAYESLLCFRYHVRILFTFVWLCIV